MLEKLGYGRGAVLTFNQKRSCGLWFIIIGLVITMATTFGGSFQVNPLIFIPGYIIGYYVSFGNRYIQNKLSQGDSSLFQDKTGIIAVIFLGILIFLIAGPFIPGQNWRMVWLGAFLATGLHFFIFYYVHGKSMLVVGTLCSFISVVGMIMASIPFIYFGIADGAVKLGVGLYLLFLSKPTTSGIK
ncbi:hypothetical protein DNH61_25250 [Paenibacillus sambharensis]|uniref:DUF308 domain-containing protein n=1 Tax=Paenibacillus sambharensis TaxID=1803190 RepID=A0A2W1L2G6_9BACL|nr:DUF6609 family protein [Paenibacillus sambharensis]PZD93089.1 hypothetical protein DNH61_25250 [Paenibacillus sambharensis]